MICHCFTEKKWRLFVLPPRFTECKLTEQITESVKISPLITIYEAAEATPLSKKIDYKWRTPILWTSFAHLHVLCCRCLIRVPLEILKGNSSARGCEKKAEVFLSFRCLAQILLESTVNCKRHISTRYSSSDNYKGIKVSSRSTLFHLPE